MNLRQARKILNRIDYIEFYDLPRPKSFRSMLHRKIKAEAVHNHYRCGSFGRKSNLTYYRYNHKIKTMMQANRHYKTEYQQRIVMSNIIDDFYE